MVSSKTARLRKIFRKTPAKVYSNLKKLSLGLQWLSALKEEFNVIWWDLRMGCFHLTLSYCIIHTRKAELRRAVEQRRKRRQQSITSADEFLGEGYRHTKRRRISSSLMTHRSADDSHRDNTVHSSGNVSLFCSVWPEFACPTNQHLKSTIEEKSPCNFSTCSCLKRFVVSFKTVSISWWGFKLSF